MEQLKKFSIEQISYLELVELKNQYKLEITPFVYDDKIGFHKILYGNEFVGVIIFTNEADLFGGGILIDYFEILEAQRNKGFGKRFIRIFFDSVRSSLEPGTQISIFITSIPEAEVFWRSLGFASNLSIQPMFKYVCIN